MITIPDRMKHLEQDHRGYPIPFVVFRDRNNKPHFTINDHRKQARCIKEDVCAICGKHLLRGRWFVGGPMSALHPRGAYIDPPLHYECMTFALQTCPYLISAKYTKRIDGKTLDPDPEGGTLVMTDPTMDPTRPKIFVAVMAVGQYLTDNGYVVPRKPYRQMEFWRDGIREQAFSDPKVVDAAMRMAIKSLWEAGMFPMETYHV